MDPYTPRRRPGTRKKNLGLSQKEYTKITGTIASVRRNRPSNADYDDDIDVRQTLSPKDAFSSSKNRADSSSFLAETSFVRAPLNSRVGTSSQAYAAGPSTASQQQRTDKGKHRQESQPNGSAKTTTTLALDRVPLEIQEALILEDLLFVLMGIEGTYVTFHPDYSPEDDDPLLGIKFVVSPLLDSSLSDLVERVLPLGTYYTAIFAFVEHRSHLDYGMVNHALCAAIREMLRDYQTLLSQLEHAYNTSPTFSLQKLWFYIHPTVHTLSLIYHLILELATADDPSGSSSTSDSDDDSDSDDEEERARKAALGLGGANLKAVLNEISGTGAGEASNVPVKGGEVLAIIYERMQNMSGDPTASAVYGKLLKKAGRPYVEILRDWVGCGRLHDPYEEVMVKESKFIDRGILEMDYTDEYWEKRYTLRDGSISAGSTKRHQAGIPPPRAPGGRLPGGACIPPLLESWKHKILLAGKYLNVIRECGIETPRNQKFADDEELSMDDERFYQYIEEAYSHANKTLLQLLLKDQQLIPRLRSLKRYFFLSQSSFLTHLLDLASTELRKSAKGASVVKLQSLLDVVLGGEAAGHHSNQPSATTAASGHAIPTGTDELTFREDLKVTMADSGLYDFLLKVVMVSGSMKTGDGDEEGSAKKEKGDKKDDKKQMQAIDAMTFDYTVKFPLSLVISRKTILRYQLLFRFLLHLKHVEQALSNMWTEQMTDPWRRYLPTNTTSYIPPTSPDNPHAEFYSWRLRVCLLRARMLAFIQQILAFVTFEVLEPNWGNLERKLEKVTTVDQLLRDHVDFLDTCLKESMLTSSKLIKACSKLIVVCQTFAFYSSSFTKSTVQAIAAKTAGEEDPTKGKRWDVLNKFETNFNHWFQVHLDCVQFYASSDNVSLLPLVVRLNSVKSGS